MGKFQKQNGGFEMNNTFDLLFTTKKDAIETIDVMKKTIDKYGYMTVNDIRDYIGYEASSYSGSLIGWMDLPEDISIEQNVTPGRGYGAWEINYTMKLPTPTSIPKSAKGNSKYASEDDKKSYNNINPEHYNDPKTDVIKFCQDNDLDFAQGNVIKYVVRYKKKNGIEDLKKAAEYLRRIIEKEEKNN